MTILLGRYPRILRLLEKMSTIYQKFYDKSMEFLLTVPGIKVLVVYYFRFLMQFRLAFMALGERYTQTELGLIGFFIATVASRLKFSGALITMSLVLCYLELHFVNMARFYRKRPTLLAQHFPEGQDPKRNMHRIKQAVVETLTNPSLGVAVGSLVAGGVGWKALDVWDTTKQEHIAEKDRENVSLNAQKDREAEDRRFDRQLEANALEARQNRDDAYRMHRENLEAEDRRHRETLEIENQKNRETRLSDIEYSKNTTSSIESSEGFVDSTQIVD